MARCEVGPGGPSFAAPPTALQRSNPELYAYLSAIHRAVFGFPPDRGGLDTTQNIDVLGLVGIDHATLTNVQPYQHHGADAHASLDRAAAVSNAGTQSGAPVTPTPSAVVITTADPGGTYTATEQALLLELKTKVNTLVSDVNAAIADLVTVAANADVGIALGNAAAAKMNALLSALRSANLVAP